MSMRIALINLPFTALDLPSIGLAQLRTVLKNTFGDAVSTRIVYLNHDFAAMLPAEMYEYMAMGTPAFVTGLGEWFFRQVAFPDLPDNTREFMRRYGHVLGDDFMEQYTTTLEPLRNKLPAMLDELIQKYELDRMHIVGMTSMFQQNLPCFALARRLKLARADQIIVMGGANCEGSMGIELVHHVPVIDFVFSGHGLISFPTFVGHAMNNTLDACHKIDGVFSRRNSRSVDTMPETANGVDWGKWPASKQLQGVRSIGTELDMNAAVELDYDDFLDSFEALPPGTKMHYTPSILLETSRGCWWGERAHCTFCGLNGHTMKYRAMNADRAVNVMEGLFRRYAGRVPRMIVVDNILPREYFDDVLPRLRTPENVSLFCEVKADLTEPQVALMARARFLAIQPGIESLATSTLKIMRKGTTAFKNVKLLQNCKRYGISPHWNLLVGFPGEEVDTYEEYVRVLPNLFHLHPPTGVYAIRFDRFSPYFTQATEYGLKLAPRDYYELCYPFSPRVLANMAYYHIDSNSEASYVHALADWIGPLEKIVARWRSLWSTGNTPPQLGYRQVDNRHFIDDQRRPHALTHVMNEQDISLLRFLEEPAREEVVDMERREGARRLRSKRLLFEERGRMMSLI